MPEETTQKFQQLWQKSRAPQLSVQLTPEFKEQVFRAATDFGQSPSEFVREALSEHITRKYSERRRRTHKAQ